MLVYRPLYSPDFGPIECCFKFIDDILQHHHLRINEKNSEVQLKLLLIQYILKMFVVI
jgi:transposase